MGLDMYLNKRTYVGAEYEHRNVKGEINISINETPIEIKFNRISYVEERVAYWRKANAIHQWFVTKVQDNKDDCRDYYVSKDQLKQLVDDCKSVINDNSLANTLLPPKSGFFFGPTDIDELYLKYIQETIDSIEPLLSEKGDFYFYYTSSW